MTLEDKPEDGRSALWIDIAPMVSLAAGSLESFRSASGVNSRLAHWAPSEPSLRWFRSFVQLAAATTPVREIEILQTVGNSSLGRPVTATVISPLSENQSDKSPPNLESHYLKADLDYLYAAEEAGFIEAALELESIKTVVELGAGFGRTAHTLLRISPTIAQYVIVDLAETLKLSSGYLKQVLTDQEFAKLRFITPDAVASIDHNFDLMIQIDGFQEMGNDVIDRFYANLIPWCTRLYHSNPIGKYLPETAGLTGINPDLVETVMVLGKSQSIVDPWDSKTLDPVRDQHVDAYRPDGFKYLISTPSRLPPLYQHVIYESVSN